MRFEWSLALALFGFGLAQAFIPVFGIILPAQVLGGGIGAALLIGTYNSYLTSQSETE